MQGHPTTQVTSKIVQQIILSLKDVKGYGSVEIYVQNGHVTQITTRKIRKTNGEYGNTRHT